MGNPDYDIQPMLDSERQRGEQLDNLYDAALVYQVGHFEPDLAMAMIELRKSLGLKTWRAMPTPEQNDKLQGLRDKLFQRYDSLHECGFIGVSWNDLRGKINYLAFASRRVQITWLEGLRLSSNRLLYDSYRVS